VDEEDQEEGDDDEKVNLFVLKTTRWDNSQC